MNTFRLKITSPDGVLLDEAVEALFVRSTSGDLAVLAHHAPFVATVAPCRCRIRLEDGRETAGRTSGGLLVVEHGIAFLLTAAFVWEPS